MRALIALLIAAAAVAAPAAASVAVGPETPASPPVYGPASLNQSSPEIATIGDLSLAVWMDGRNSVRGTRIRRGSRVIDSDPLRICSGWVSLPVQVFAAGERFWVACGTSEDGGSRWVDLDGRVSVAATLPAGAPVVDGVFDGTNLVLLRREPSTGPEGGMFLTLVDRDGRVVADEPLAGAIVTPFARLLLVGGEVVLVAVVHVPTGHDIVSVNVDRQGHPHSPRVLTSTGIRPYSFAAATNGAEVLVTWCGSSGMNVSTVEGLRVGADGSLTTMEIGRGRFAANAVIALGSGFVALLNDFATGVEYAQVIGTPTTVPLNRWFGVLSAAPSAPGLTIVAMASTGGPGGTDIEGLTLDGAMDVVAQFPVALSVTEQAGPAIAHGASTSLLAWVEPRTYEQRTVLLAAVVAADGRHVSPPMEVSDDTGGYPRVAFDGTNWLLLWPSSGGTLLGRRVGLDGTLLDDPPIIVSTARRYGTSLQVTWDGERYLVTWLSTTMPEYHGFWAPALQVGGVFVDSRAGVGAPFLISPKEDDGTRWSDAAAGGSSSIAVWTAGDGIDFAFVRRSGAVSGTIHLSDRGSMPRAVWTGSAFLVAWLDHGLLYRAVIREDGSVTPAAGPPLLTGIVQTQSAFPLFALARYGDGAMAVGGVSDVDAVIFDAAGNVAGEVVPISRTPLDERAAVTTGGDTPVVAYMRAVDNAGESARYRVFFRTLRDGGARRRAIR